MAWWKTIRTWHSTPPVFCMLVIHLLQGSESTSLLKSPINRFMTINHNDREYLHAYHTEQCTLERRKGVGTPVSLSGPHLPQQADGYSGLWAWLGVWVLPEESGGELLGLCLHTGWWAVPWQYSLQCIPTPNILTLILRQSHDIQYSLMFNWFSMC